MARQSKPPIVLGFLIVIGVAFVGFLNFRSHPSDVTPPSPADDQPVTGPQRATSSQSDLAAKLKQADQLTDKMVAAPKGGGMGMQSGFVQNTSMGIFKPKPTADSTTSQWYNTQAGNPVAKPETQQPPVAMPRGSSAPK